MLVLSLISGVFGGFISAAFAMVNGAGWWLALLAYSGGGIVAMLLTLTLAFGLARVQTIPSPTQSAKAH